MPDCLRNIHDQSMLRQFTERFYMTAESKHRILHDIFLIITPIQIFPDNSKHQSLMLSKNLLYKQPLRAV